MPITPGQYGPGVTPGVPLLLRQNAAGLQEHLLRREPPGPDPQIITPEVAAEELPPGVDHVRTGAAAVEFTGEAIATAEVAKTGTGLLGLTGAGVQSTSAAVTYQTTGTGQVDLEGAGDDAVTSVKTGGATIPMSAGGERETTPLIGVSYGGPGGMPDEGRFHIKTGRAHLAFVGSGTALVEVDELARMIDRLRLEDELILVGVL